MVYNMVSRQKPGGRVEARTSDSKMTSNVERYGTVSQRSSLPSAMPFMFHEITDSVEKAWPLAWLEHP